MHRDEPHMGNQDRREGEGVHKPPEKETQLQGRDVRNVCVCLHGSV